jgi:recombination protein RecT
MAKSPNTRPPNPEPAPQRALQEAPAEPQRAINPSVEFFRYISRPEAAEQFAAALPRHMPVERYVRALRTAVQNNPELVNCKRSTLMLAVMKCAQDGLLPDGKEAALVPYKGDVTYIPMIQGIRKKVRNSGEIASWDVHAVYERDEFEYLLGDSPRIHHRPSIGSERPGNLIAVYSVAVLKSGEKSIDVMPVWQVEEIRKAASRAQKGPWSIPAYYAEMAKKTVARRHSKVLPMSTDLDDLIRRDDHLYDLKGGADAEIRKRPTLGGALDALALGGPAVETAAEPAAAGDPPHDEDGVIQEDVEDDGHQDPQDPEAAREAAEDVTQEDDFPGDRPTPEAGAVGSSFAREVEAETDAQEGGRAETPEDLAYGAGWEAFTQKRPRTAPRTLKTAQEAEAWLRGYDEHKAQNGGKKR